MPIQDAYRKILAKQQYRIVGRHSGVKLCHWMRQKLIFGRACYKEDFYGIQCHRCLQMTPTINQCTLKCLFCWRHQGFSETLLEECDDPREILDKAIEAQRKLISGFKGDERCNLELWKEAQNPNQVAISLSGEPTLYSGLGDFIAECKRRGFTTFLVTNGTKPEVLEKLNPLPTQLYVTVAAPNEDIFKKLCVPMVDGAWNNLKKTLELLPSLKYRTRTVIRHTLVENWNVANVEEYAKLDAIAKPDFIEPKGYVFVGYSRMRMSINNMPSQERIREFSKKLAELVGYEYVREKADSRVTLLSSKGPAVRLNLNTL